MDLIKIEQMPNDISADLAQAFVRSGKIQNSVMEVDGPDISRYCVVVPKGAGKGISGLVEKPDASAVPSNLVSIGRYVLTPDIIDTLRRLKKGSRGEIQFTDAINTHAKRELVDK